MGEHKSSEMASLIDSFESMKNLYWKKLTTPLEELNSMINQIKALKTRTKDLENIRNTRQENLSKYLEESNEMKELREMEIQNLKK